MDQGALAVTGHSLDLAIWGKGFFVLERGEGQRPQRVYTRDGRFLVQPNGTLVSRWLDGARLVPDTFVPVESTDLAISSEGKILHKKATDFIAREVGRLALAWFDHPEFLEPIGDSLFAQTPACGSMIQGHPTEDGLGRVIQGRLELSNVDVPQTWTDLCRLEDARQVVLAMIASLDPPGWLAASDLKSSPESTAARAVVSLPLHDPPPQRSESTLLRYLRLRGVDALATGGSIHLRCDPLTASAMATYLKFLRNSLSALADNIAGAQASAEIGTKAQPYRRRFVDLADSGEVKLVEDFAPQPMIAAEESNELTAGSNVEIAQEMALVDSLSAEYRDVRDCLRRMGPVAVPALVELLGDETPAVRCDAAWAIGQIGPDATTAGPALILALSASASDVRAAAADAIEHVIPNDEHASQAVVEMWANDLKSSSPELRYRAALSLGRMGPKAISAIPELIQLVSDPQSGAARALGEMGPNATDAVPALVEALAHPQKHLREQAADALGKIGPNAAAAVPALVQAMKDTNPEVRWRCAAAIAMIGSGDSGCIAAVGELLKVEDEYVRGRVGEVLSRVIGSSAELEKTLGDALARQSPDEKIWPLAFATAMSDHKPLPESSLTALLLDQKRAVRIAACRVLGKFTTFAKPCLPILIKLAKDEDTAVAAAAIEALGDLGPLATDAVQTLTICLNTADPLLCCRAATALGCIGVAASPAAPALARCAQSDNELVVIASTTALGRIGPPAAVALDHLRRLETTGSASVRSAASQAVLQIARIDPGQLNEGVSQTATEVERVAGDPAGQ
jgi:HEAT repeat protein/flagellar basal body rod protein FlgF